MGGKSMVAPLPQYVNTTASYKHDWRLLLRSCVQDHFSLRIEMLRDFALNQYRILVRVVNSDLTLHGELEELVNDLRDFPSETFKTQLMMLAG